MTTYLLHRPMTPRTAMSEESMQRMEALIPKLAHIEVQRARRQAVATSGKVVEARNGQLIESYADGMVRLIRTIAKPVAVAVGTKLRAAARLVAREKTSI